MFTTFMKKKGRILADNLTTSYLMHIEIRKEKGLKFNTTIFHYYINNTFFRVVKVSQIWYTHK